MSLRGIATPLSTAILNTDGTAFYASGAEAALGTLTWTAVAAPSGTVIKNYRFERVGKATTFTMNINASVAGTSVTKLQVDLPSAAPTPVAFTGVPNNEIQYGSSGMPSTVNTSIAANNRNGILLYTGTKWIIQVDQASANLSNVSLTFNYIAA